MSATYVPSGPVVTITLELADGAERDLDCSYYIEAEDRSVGIFGDTLIVEETFWTDDYDADVPEEIWEGRKTEIEELAWEAFVEECNDAMEP